MQQRLALDGPVSHTRMTERIASVGAMVLYGASSLALMWTYAHDYSRSADVADPGGLAAAAWLAAVFVLPVVVGFGIGRYWAPAVIVILFIATGIATDLEPLKRPEPAELEATPALVALFGAIVHAPLLLVGAWMRKRLWPRGPSKKWWFLPSL